MNGLSAVGAFGTAFALVASNVAGGGGRAVGAAVADDAARTANAAGGRNALNASGDDVARASKPKGARGPTTRWDGFDDTLAGGPVRILTTDGVRVTSRGVDVVERHVARFGPDRSNEFMIERLRQINSGKVSPTAQDLNFYTHELREFVRYRKRGYSTGVPRDEGARDTLYRQAHSATLYDYGLPVGGTASDGLLYFGKAFDWLYEL